jgi:hypothetical protein
MTQWLRKSGWNEFKEISGRWVMPRGQHIDMRLSRGGSLYSTFGREVFAETLCQMERSQ